MEQLDLFSWKPARRRLARRKKPREWKIVAVRETGAKSKLRCDTPEAAADYWRQHIATGPNFNPEVECFAVLLLNVKYHVRGHHIVSIGSLNETIAHPREVFRAAVIGSAYAIVCMHNHPSGDPTPSNADRQTTSTLAATGRVLRIELLDHVIVGSVRHYSMRETGAL